LNCDGTFPPGGMFQLRRNDDATRTNAGTKNPS
jgi:hypothetical protein